jgi:hypothetical protein
MNISTNIGGDHEQAADQGEGHAGMEPGPVLGQARCQLGIGEIAQANPVAGQEAQMKEAKNRGGDVGDRAGHRLQQQPAAEHGA